MLFFIILPRVELSNLETRSIPQFPSDLYNAFHRSLFVASLGFFLAPLQVGRLSLVKGFLGNRAWAPWAKVTFVAYLIHLAVMGAIFATSKGGIYMTGPLNIFYSLASFLVTIVLAVPIALIIESPVLQLERLVLFPPPLKKTEDQKLRESYQINDTIDSELTTDEKLSSLKQKSS